MKNIPRFSLILPNIRSRHNVGALFRTADGAGVEKIFLTGYTPRPPHPDIAKVALGADTGMPWEHHHQTARLLKKLKSAGATIVGLEQTKKSDTIYAWRPTFPLVFVVGNEVTGITKNILALCDHVVHIPMRGNKNSLNVSVAAAVGLFRASMFLDQP